MRGPRSVEQGDEVGQVERADTKGCREYWQAGAVSVLMALVFFWPLLSGRVLSQADVLYFFPPWNEIKPADLTAPSNPVLSDQTREFLTFFHLAREFFRQQEVPLWNPYIMAGTPLLANSQSALLFPLNWSFYFFPFYLGFTISALLKVCIASLGMYAFARTLSLSPVAALLASAAYTFSAFNIFWLNHPHTNVTIFLPLLFLLAERIKKSPSPRSMALLGLVTGGQFLGGHVEIAFHIAIAVSLFFLFRLYESAQNGRSWLSRILTFVGGYTLGFLLSGVLLVPFLEFLFHSATWQVRSQENPFTLHPLGLATFVVPISGWSPLDLSFYHSFSLYVGVCPLVLALTLFMSRPQRLPLFFAGLSLFALAVIFRFPPVFAFLTALPLFKQAPNWYMVIFCTFSISLLGGMGLDSLLRRKGRAEPYGQVGKLVVGISAVLSLLAISLLWLMIDTSLVSALQSALEGSLTSTFDHIFSQLASSVMRSLLFAVLAVILLGSAWQSFLPKNLLGILAVGFTFTDLFLAGARWNPTVPVQWSTVQTPPSVRFLQRDTAVYRVAGIGAVMPPNTATLCGLHDIRGYDVPVEQRYHNFFQKVLGGQAEWWRYEFPTLAVEALPFLSLLNVKYLLSRDPLPPPLSLVYDEEIKIYENSHVFPRAFLVHRVETVQDEQAALDRVIELDMELRQVAVLEGPVPTMLQALVASENRDGQADRVQIVKYTARQIEMHVETSSPGLLVLSDTYFPGWEAYVDGEEAVIYRVDYLLRAVAVEEGSHRVVFLYRPLSFRIGLGLTVGAGAIIVWCLRVKRRSLAEG